MSTKIDNNKHPPRNARYRLQKKPFLCFFYFLLSIWNENAQQKHSHAHTDTHMHTERDEQNIRAHIKIARKKIT